jgi:hypothetical protein
MVRKIQEWKKDRSYLNEKGKTGKFVTGYEIILPGSGDVLSVLPRTREELIELRNDIDELLQEVTTGEILGISEDEEAVVNTHYETDELCKNCSNKLSPDCLTCLFTLDSPLERKLFLELKKRRIRFTPQYALDKKGNPIYNYVKGTKPPELLTIPDFFIEKKGRKLCIYTDGHTYHNTEDHAVRDRSIDRKLGELGYDCKRFVGKEINIRLNTVLVEIERWIENATYSNK